MEKEALRNFIFEIGMSINLASFKEDIYDLDLMPFNPKEKEFIVKGFIIEPFLPKAQVEELL